MKFRLDLTKKQHRILRRLLETYLPPTIGFLQFLLAEGYYSEELRIAVFMLTGLYATYKKWKRESIANSDSKN